jgi:hypothetical protein
MCNELADRKFCCSSDEKLAVSRRSLIRASGVLTAGLGISALAASKRNHVRQLEALGYTVTLTPAA